MSTATISEFFGNTFWVLGTLFTISTAWLKYKSEWFKNKNERAELQNKYKKAWQVIDATGVLNLPVKTIQFFLRIESFLTWIQTTAWRYTGNKAIFYSLIPLPTVLYVLFNIDIGIGLVLIFVVVIPFVMFFHEEERYQIISLFETVIANITLAVFLVTNNFAILKVISSLNVYNSLLIILLTLPITIWSTSLLFDFIIPLVIINHEKITEKDYLGSSFALSIFITTISFTIGFYIYPHRHIPQSMQMYFVNIIMDTVTIIVTLNILKRVISGKIRLFYAICLDLILSALFACSSLYLGLVGSSNAVSIKETAFILLGKDKFGSDFYFDAYFWVMHTSFIPTILFLSFVFFTLIAKKIVLPILKLLKKAETFDKPHDLTAAFLGFIAVFFFSIAALIEKFFD
ncbi:hypothetical protein [Carboxylicivirga marina]|uniref:hypothetical protein n=1 Tax=Carboxylicivirga marina TaxID=2800988 RepID=UPI0025939594|nr:hypothetical protein [uncultured Carboxylicivirga sp.]